MATFTFDGSTSQTVAFNATVDRVVFNLDAADLAAVVQDEDNNTVTFVAVSGAILTLTGTNFAALNANDGSIIAGIDSDIDFAFGTDGVDALAGNVVVGLEDDDTLNAFVVGTDNFDGALAFGNEGDDDIFSDGANVRLYGGMGNDEIENDNTDSDSESLFVGGLGEDTITALGGLEGALTVFGGNEAGDPSDGADLINVAIVDGGSAVIFGNGGGDTINVTGDGNASVYGGQGGDTVTAAVNSGLFVGGLGTDTISVTLTETDSSATIFGGNEAGDPTDGADLITVTTTEDGGSATIFSNGGGDTVTLSGATDTQFSIYTGQGNDIVTGSVGDASVVYGGLGIDQIAVSVTGGATDSDESVTIYGGNGSADAADGADSITVDLLTTTPAPVGAIQPADVDQTAVVYGNGGDDVISLTGEGEATVFGGAGSDVISVQGGQYELTGGAGNDTFDFFNAPSVTTEDTLSSITDFNFANDELRFDTVPTDDTTVGRATLATAADVDAIADANTTVGQVAVITVTSGNLAGDYAVLGDQVIDITGFTDPVSAEAFVA